MLSDVEIEILTNEIMNHPKRNADILTSEYLIMAKIEEYSMILPTLPDNVEGWIDILSSGAARRKEREQFIKEKEAQKQKINYYEEKNKILMEKYIKMESLEILRYVFPEHVLQSEDKMGSRDGKPNTIIGVMYHSKNSDRNCMQHRMVFDNHKVFEECQGKVAVYSPNTYFGRARRADKIDSVMGFILDIDDVSLSDVSRLLIPKIESNEVLKPNIVVNSGNGFHLYYMLQEPIQLHHAQDRVRKQLNHLKIWMAQNIWPQLSPKNVESHGIDQAYALPGSKNRKNNDLEVVGYMVRKEKYKIEELNDWLPQEQRADLSFPSIKKYTIDEMMKINPNWVKRKVEKDPEAIKRLNDYLIRRGKNNNFRARYNYWLQECRGIPNPMCYNSKGVQVSCRYNSLIILAHFAKRCGVPFEQLKSDANSLLGHFNALPNADKNPFTQEELDNAISYYKRPYAHVMSYDWIDSHTAAKIRSKDKWNKELLPKEDEKINENREKIPREVSIVMAREACLQKYSDPWEVGRRVNIEKNGDAYAGARKAKASKPKTDTEVKQDIKEWISNNPKAEPMDYIALGVHSKDSIYRYWDECRKELKLRKRETKQDKLMKYIKSHPECTKAECIKELEFSKSFVYKYFDDFKKKLLALSEN